MTPGSRRVHTDSADTEDETLGRPTRQIPPGTLPGGSGEHKSKRGDVVHSMY